MVKIYNILIVLSFIGLWLTSIVPSDYEPLLGFILIFSFGILHGSNDILIIENTSNSNKTRPYLSILALYLLIVIFAVVIFYFIPLFALIFFVLFSAYHFGEQHWESKNLNIKKPVKKIYFFIYGLFVLMLLFIFNNEEVVAIVESISQFTLENHYITYTFIATSLIMILLTIYILYKDKNFKSIVLKEFFYLLIFSIVFKVSTLIWGFTIYFILWHSIPSLVEQITFLYGTFKKENLILYIRKALPYWLISIMGLGIVFYFFKDEQILYGLFFSLIAAVTFPHSIVISKMFNQKQRTQ